MLPFSIFIVEDDLWYGEVLGHYLSLNPEYTVQRFTTDADCLAQLYQNPDLITVDYALPDMDGSKLLEKIKAQHPDVPVIIISGQEDIAVAVQLLKAGAYDYIIKDNNTREMLWKSVMKARETSNLRKEVDHLREELGVKYNFEKSIVGNSQALRKVFAMMKKAIPTTINVSITGETGTGKEVVAKAIHYNGPRRKKPFVAVNMAAIPHELLESELFGHEKGSFTGAMARKIGKFEEANGGTLFLDEIAEMDLNVQSKLLRVLQERELVLVGGQEKVALDVRVIVATHKHLPNEVKEKRFREDLYFRIMGLPIELPPLRDRGNDVLLLAKHILDEFAKSNNMETKSFSPDAHKKMLRYHWPGNVRELKAVVELAAVVSSDEVIHAEDLIFTNLREEENVLAIEKSLREHTHDVIQHYLNKYDKDEMLVARKLKVGKSTLYRMIQAGELNMN